MAPGRRGRPATTPARRSSPSGTSQPRLERRAAGRERARRHDGRQLVHRATAAAGPPARRPGDGGGEIGRGCDDLQLDAHRAEGAAGDHGRHVGGTDAEGGVGRRSARRITRRSGIWAAIEAGSARSWCAVTTSRGRRRTVAQTRSRPARHGRARVLLQGLAQAPTLSTSSMIDGSSHPSGTAEPPAAAFDLGGQSAASRLRRWARRDGRHRPVGQAGQRRQQVGVGVDHVEVDVVGGGPRRGRRRAWRARRPRSGDAVDEQRSVPGATSGRPGAARRGRRRGRRGRRRGRLGPGGDRSRSGRGHALGQWVQVRTARSGPVGGGGDDRADEPAEVGRGPGAGWPSSVRRRGGVGQTAFERRAGVVHEGADRQRRRRPAALARSSAVWSSTRSPAPKRATRAAGTGARRSRPRPGRRRRRPSRRRTARAARCAGRCWP